MKSNGYVVYPSGTFRQTLVSARKLARAEAKREGFARVERASDNATVAVYPSRSNPALGKRPKLGQWIPAHRVRLVKVNGRVGLEVQRTVKNPKKKAGPSPVDRLRTPATRAMFSAYIAESIARAKKKRLKKEAKRR